MDGSDSVSPVDETPSVPPAGGRWHVAAQVNATPPPDLPESVPELEPEEVATEPEPGPEPGPEAVEPEPEREYEAVATEPVAPEPEPEREPIANYPPPFVAPVPPPMTGEPSAAAPVAPVIPAIPFDPAEPEPVASVAEAPRSGRKGEGKPRKHRRRALRVLGAVVLALLLVAAGAVIGVALRQSAVNDARDRANAAAQQIRSLQSASTAQAVKVSQLQRELRARDATIAAQRTEIEGLGNQPTSPPQSQTTQPQSQTTQPQQTPTSAGSFGDGLYQVGSDIQAGQYRTQGGAACYWAKLTTADSNSVLVNNVTAGPQTVTIDSPFFVSDGCGNWTKVG
jgi:hypothetical protein